MKNFLEPFSKKESRLHTSLIFLCMGLYGGFFAASTVVPMVTPTTVRFQSLNMGFIAIPEECHNCSDDLTAAVEIGRDCEAAHRDCTGALANQVAKTVSARLVFASCNLSLDDCQDDAPCAREKRIIEEFEAFCGLDDLIDAQKAADNWENRSLTRGIELDVSQEKLWKCEDALRDQKASCKWDC